jgi:hypothetical protein
LHCGIYLNPYHKYSSAERKVPESHVLNAGPCPTSEVNSE